MYTMDFSLDEQIIRDLKSRLDSLGMITLNNTEMNELHFCDGNCVSLNTSKSKSNRFLINLYERPRNSLRKTINSESTPDKSNRTHQFGNNKYWTLLQKSDNNNNHENFSNYDYGSRLTMEQFLDLKLRRDVECLKMKEASKVLQLLNNYSRYGCWLEKLLTEKVLLESGYAVDVLTNKIRDDCGYPPDVTIGKISVSNLQFNLNKIQPRPHRETEFFIALLSNQIEVKTTKIARAVNGEINFNDHFNFSVDSKFCIKIELYSITMKEVPKFFTLTKALMKKTQRNAFAKLQYKNLNTADIEESKVLKTSFKLCAQTEILPSNLHNHSWELDVVLDANIQHYASFSVVMDSFKIDKKRSGFLTFAFKFNTGYVWNRRWCVLEDRFLTIYNSPTEEDIADPVIVLNMEHCASNRIDLAPRTLCNRSKSLMVDMCEGQDKKISRYFFMADNNFELKDWINDLNLVLDLIKFQKTFLC